MSAMQQVREGLAGSEVEVIVDTLRPELIPTYATPGSACFDIRSAERRIMGYQDTAKIATGLRFKIPEGFCLQVFSRSGLTFRDGIVVANGVGIIDSDYRGELFVLLVNNGFKTYTIEEGDRIAQGLITPTPRVSFTPGRVSEDRTERGTGGFGSTGT